MGVLILGATSPIARAVARCYAADGHSLFFADIAEAEQVASDIRLRADVQTHHAAFDAIDLEGHEAFIDRVEEAIGHIDIALVAFGEMGVQGESEEDFDRAKRVFDINFTGAASVCEAISRRMGARRHGAIIGISSVAGDRGRASNYFYGTAKGAFSVYLQGLRNRLFKSGVQVLTVKLGFIDTKMTYGMQTAIPIASPQQAGRAIYRAQLRGADTLYYPPFWRGIMGIIKTIPEGVFKRMSL